jgi:hypothetical protein
MKNLSQESFFRIGFYVFILTAVFNTCSLIITYELLNIFAILSNITGIFFNVVLAWLFYSMIQTKTNTDAELTKFEERFNGFTE